MAAKYFLFSFKMIIMSNGTTPMQPWQKLMGSGLEHERLNFWKAYFQK